MMTASETPADAPDSVSRERYREGPTVDVSGGGPPPDPPVAGAVRRNMQANRGRDTGPEVRIRSLLHAAGLRYRVNQPLPFDRRRRADITFPKVRLYVFIDGCFWHRCPEHFVEPKTRTQFWLDKVQGNRLRDADTRHRLESAGATVVRVWEHDDPSIAAERIRSVYASLRAAVALRADREAIEGISSGDMGTTAEQGRRAWLVLALDDHDRQYGGNDGYKDDVSRFYSWNSRVANSGNIQVGDRLVLWDKKSLLGCGTIEQIEESDGWVTRRLCPSCGDADVKFRKTKSPDWRCQHCATEFDIPATEEVPVTHFRAYFERTWIDLPGLLDAAALRVLALSPRSQHSMREMDWDDFVSATAEAERRLGAK